MMDMVGALGKQENIDAALKRLDDLIAELQAWRKLLTENAIGFVPKKEQA